MRIVRVPPFASVEVSVTDAEVLIEVARVRLETTGGLFELKTPPMPPLSSRLWQTKQLTFAPRKS